METKVSELHRSLVGSSIEFSFKKKVDDEVSLERTLENERVRIRKSLSLIDSATNDDVKETAYAELLDYYARQTYYMGVRGNIVLKRFRIRSIEYLNKFGVADRAKIIKEMLTDDAYKGKDDRNAIIEALRYFLTTYQGRCTSFKEYLTREEYMIVI